MITYEKLKQKYSGDFVPCGELLRTEKWKAKRDEIVERDERECQKCGERESFTFIGERHYQLFHKDEIAEISGEFGIPTNEIFEWRENSVILNSKAYHLHVHHRYYVLEWHPWKYPDDALITLCHRCHNEVHENESIPAYASKDKKQLASHRNRVSKSHTPHAEGLVELDLTPCYRCNGAGYFPQYKHINNGVCFRCDGTCYEELPSIYL